ncbi:hypothetical protein PDJAM_G00012740, partial [Pangasius djambal]|nr:hypothetical protein [Pangasius djambal]
AQKREGTETWSLWTSVRKKSFKNTYKSFRKECVCRCVCVYNIGFGTSVYQLLGCWCVCVCVCVCELHLCVSASQISSEYKGHDQRYCVWSKLSCVC